MECKMKKSVISFVIIGFLTFFVGGCATTSTFSSEAKQSSGNIVISTDSFLGTKTAEYKERRFDAVFVSDLSCSLGFEPCFIMDENENLASINLKIKLYTNAKTADARFERIIFLSDKGRITVQLDPLSQSPKFIYKNQIFGNQYETRCDVRISKDEYLKLHDFIVNSSSIRCAVYTTSNKASELREDGSSAHQVFNELYNYYEENLMNMEIVSTEKAVIQ